MTWQSIDSAQKVFVLAISAMVVGCNAPAKCVDGELYKDRDANGIYVREYSDFTGKVPVRCVSQTPPEQEQ